MAPIFKILMSPGSRKEHRITILFSQKVPTNESPTGPLWGEIPVYRAFLRLFYYVSFYLYLRIPGKAAPSMFPNRVLMDRATPSAEPLVYLFIYVCLPESPK
jgi:hypothetical protein